MPLCIPTLLLLINSFFIPSQSHFLTGITRPSSIKNIICSTEPYLNQGDRYGVFTTANKNHASFCMAHICIKLSWFCCTPFTAIPIAICLHAIPPALAHAVRQLPPFCLPHCEPLLPYLFYPCGAMASQRLGHSFVQGINQLFFNGMPRTPIVASISGMAEVAGLWDMHQR